MHEQFDMLIVGAGAVGCAIARELSRSKLRIGVVDKGCDVASGASGRNSAVVHAGFNNKPGSLMTQLCVGATKILSLCARSWMCRTKRPASCWWPLTMMKWKLLKS